MSNGNPFYVHPGTDFGPGLMGLANTVERVGVRKKAEQKEQDEIARIDTMKKGAAEVYKTGDPDKIAEYAIANPEISKVLIEATKHKSKQTEDNYTDALFRAIQNPDQIPDIARERQALLQSEGVGPEGSQETDSIAERYKDKPEETIQALKNELAFRAPKKWKAFKDAMEPMKSTDKIKNFEYHQELLKDDPLGAATFAKTTGSSYSPSPLKKLIGERQALIEDGAALDDPIIRAYDSKISGTDIDIENLTPDEVDTWGAYLNLTGKMPTLGRGKQSTKIRAQIVKSAASQALGIKNFGEEDAEPTKTPAQAALDVIGSQADTKSIQVAQNSLEKQLSSMGSFVDNIGMQVEKVAQLSEDLHTFDTRLLNVPLRILRGKILGSPLQAKYDMYLTEIESEIGKLATGSAASVAELSQGAQEKWAKIHDKNLSVKDMLELLDETREAAKMRKKSVEVQLELVRSKMRNRTDVKNTSEVPDVKSMSDEDLQKIVRGE